MSKFPWDIVKANTLRAICSDVGITAARKREDMILFLTLAEEHGIDAALKQSERSIEQPIRVAERRTRRLRGVDATPQKMITRNRGKRTKSYRAILNPTSQSPPLLKKRKRARAPLPVPVPVAHKFRGVILPSARHTLAFRKHKTRVVVDEKEASPQPMSDPDMDAPHEIDDGERQPLSETGQLLPDGDGNDNATEPSNANATQASSTVAEATERTRNDPRLSFPWPVFPSSIGKDRISVGPWATTIAPTPAPASSITPGSQSGPPPNTTPQK